MYRNWFGWVTTNLGRDARLAEIAASAATDAALHGRGFNSAAEAARTAWADGAKRSSNDQRSMPLAQPGAQPGPPPFFPPTAPGVWGFGLPLLVRRALVL